MREQDVYGKVRFVSVNDYRYHMKNWKWVIALFMISIIVVCYFSFNVGVKFNPNSDDIQLSWSAFNTSIAILEIYIVLFSIGITLAGVWGYNQIKLTVQDAVQEKVITTIRNELLDSNTELGKKFKQTIKESSKPNVSIGTGEQNG